MKSSSRKTSVFSAKAFSMISVKSVRDIRMPVGLLGLHKKTTFTSLISRIKLAASTWKLELNFICFGLAPAFLAAFSYSPNVGAGISATSSLFMKTSANK